MLIFLKNLKDVPTIFKFVASLIIYWRMENRERKNVINLLLYLFRVPLTKTTNKIHFYEKVVNWL